VSDLTKGSAPLDRGTYLRLSNSRWRLWRFGKAAQHSLWTTCVWN